MSRPHSPAAEARGPVEASQPRANRAARRWPADDPAELGAQLRHQLERLASAVAPANAQDALRLASAYLKHAQALAWRAVGRGDLDAPRRLLDSLLTAHPFLDAHLPDLETPARAAVRLHGTLQALYVAVEALEEVRTRARLADRKRSAIERAVLRVLAANTHRHLRRGQIHELLDVEEGKEPSVARVGQILAKLFDEGMLIRLQSTAQGNPETSFYALSGLGWEMWSGEIGDAEELRKKAPFQELVDAATDPMSSEDEIRVATGVLAASCFIRPSEVPIDALLRTARERKETQTEQQTRELCRNVILSGIVASRIGERETAGQVTFRDDPSRWQILADQEFSKAYSREMTATLPATGRSAKRPKASSPRARAKRARVVLRRPAAAEPDPSGEAMQPPDDLEKLAALVVSDAAQHSVASR